MLEFPAHDREASDEPATPGRSTDVFQIRQAIEDRTLTFGRLLAAYDHPLDIDTEAIGARMDGRERARRTRRGGRACASTGYSRLVMGGFALQRRISRLSCRAGNPVEHE